MIENVLWVAVAFMLGCSLISKKRRIGKLLGAIGWGIFSLHWFYQPMHFIQIEDYVNVLLVIVVGIICLILAYNMFKEYRNLKPMSGQSVDVTYMATVATALASLFYFPFAQMDSLNVWIISLVTDNVFWTLQILGQPAEMAAWNKISLDGYHVEIILACTAIESIALFIGLIASVNAPLKKLVSAFLVSVPIIYTLNIIRDVFVIVAYAYQWFGPNSFEIAHHTIAKIGSGLALFGIAYIVMRILPELVDLIEGIWKMVAEYIHSIYEKVSGND
jgi:archaeosortase A (PGF-CTERM-specific)